MQKIRYSPDVDALLIQVSDEPISHAEEDGQMILHYSKQDKLVLIEILEVQKFIAAGDDPQMIMTPEH
ncbi:DUF2283 domain-containing protein [Leptolyngbya sp. NIES-2104]|uniref:DUF2283 domain-containing protein n=1 Tax=Leptolyngbya sp. NIES-2104 TaxID=1552121 RepID=UPI0006EC4F68|nr:DUF2283 domain-containing protein [Leptolyngbya sp. NIES-2104]GAP94668.1 hypothetical protein NIES2104_11790 [Leptolyngbya sp. NIES-2104]